MYQKFWTFEQTEPSTTWNITNVPDGAEGAAITHIKGNDGQILQPDNQIVSPDGLQLSFGVEAVAGTAYGMYFTEDLEVDGEVNITVNKLNREYTPVTFENKTEVRASGVMGHLYVKVGENYIPAINPPSYDEADNKLVWTFNTPTSGLIV